MGSHLLAWLDGHLGVALVGRGLVRQLRIHVGGYQRMTKTVNTATTGLALWVIQRKAQEVHQAALGADVVVDLLPLTLANLCQVLDTLIVRAVGHRCALPYTAILNHRRR